MVQTDVTGMKISKSKAHQYVMDVHCEEIFWSHDGRTFKNLQELALGLISMDDETYAYHANNNKNDFAHWVREVVGDHELADELEGAMSRQEASERVTNRVSFLNSVK